MLIVRADSILWVVKRVAGRELFVSPEGPEYVRTDEARAEVRIDLKKGPALFLRPESSERLERVEARKARRAERRERARKVRSAPVGPSQEKMDRLSVEMEREHIEQFEEGE